jgi:hypothetical protein
VNLFARPLVLVILHDEENQTKSITTTVVNNEQEQSAENVNQGKKTRTLSKVMTK